MKIVSVRKSYLLAVFLLILTQSTYSQYFTTGVDPVKLRWGQIDQEKFKFLYPENSKEQALVLSNFLSQGMSSIGASMNHVPRKFPLILHSYSAISNGYTIWAPRRVELYPRPPIIGGAESFADHLMIHELRHMVQMDKLNQGITKFASYFLGDQAVAAVVGLHMPNWLTEGDAVLTETLLSHSGRGRQALFSQDLRTLWLNKSDYSYDKSIFGSYKDYVPNHYVLGYHMVAMGRLLGGPLIWSKAIDTMGKRPYRPALLNRFLKKEIGLSRGELYKKTFSWMSSYWQNQTPKKFNPPTELNLIQNDIYTDYIKPVMLTPDDFVVLKNSMDGIPEFVKLDRSGFEEHLTYPGYIDNGSFSLKGNLLVWAESNPDKRWGNQSFSNIYTLDISRGKKRKITKGRKLFAPDLNSQGDYIACLEYKTDGLTDLLILDSYSGIETHRFSAPEGQVFQQAFWDDQGLIWSFATGRNGKVLYQIDPENQQVIKVLSFGFKEVFNPVKIDSEIFFIAPHGQTNAVYSLSIKDQSIKLVSNDLYGINYLSVANDDLLVSVYRENGYKPAVINVQLGDEFFQKHIPDLDDPILPLLVRAEGEDVLEINPSKAEFETKKYRKGLHWFKFHSWAPASLDLTGYQLKPGIMLLAQNDLSTMMANFGADYNVSKSRIEYYTSVKGILWYPEAKLSARTYHDQDFFNLSPNDTVHAQIDYQYYGLTSTFSVPLNFSSGRWYRGLTSAVSVNYHSYNGHSVDNNIAYNNTMLGLGIGVKAYAYSRMSRRDLFPKIGYIANVSTQVSSSYFSKEGATYLIGSIQSFLPGIATNHSTRVYLGGYLFNEWMLPDPRFQ